VFSIVRYCESRVANGSHASFARRQCAGGVDKDGRGRVRDSEYGIIMELRYCSITELAPLLHKTSYWYAGIKLGRCYGGNWTLRLRDISPTRHFAYDMDTSPPGHFAYWTVRLMDSSPTRQFAYEMDISPTRHFAANHSTKQA